MSANAFPYLFSFCSETVQLSPWKTFSPASHICQRGCLHGLFYCFVLISPAVIHSKALGSTMCFAWDSTCSLTNCAGMEKHEDNKRQPGSCSDGNRKYYHTERNFQDNLSPLPSHDLMLEQALWNGCCVLFRLWYIFRSGWNATFRQPVIGTGVWTLAIAVKRRKGICKQSPMMKKRGGQVWFRGKRLCKVRMSLYLTACFQHSWCLQWECNFRSRATWGSSGKPEVTWLLTMFGKRQQHLLLVKPGPVSYCWSSWMIRTWPKSLRKCIGGKQFRLEKIELASIVWLACFLSPSDALIPLSPWDCLSCA